MASGPHKLPPRGCYTREPRLLARLSEYQPERYLLESVRLFERPGSSPLPVWTHMHWVQDGFVCLLAYLLIQSRECCHLAQLMGSKGLKKQHS